MLESEAALIRTPVALPDEKPDWVVMHDPVWVGPETQVAALPEFHQGYELAHRTAKFLLWRKR